MTDYRDSAGWRETFVSNEKFLEAVSEENWHPLFSVPGFHHSTQRIDFMHNVFQGNFLHAAANLIWSLTLIGHFGPLHIGLKTLNL